MASLEPVSVSHRLFHRLADVKPLDPFHFGMNAGEAHQVRCFPEGDRNTRRDGEPCLVQYTGKLQLSAPALSLRCTAHFTDTPQQLASVPASDVQNRCSSSVHILSPTPEAAGAGMVPP